MHDLIQAVSYQLQSRVTLPHNY